MCPTTGVPLSKREFIANFGGMSEWHAATPETEERRVDPADGNSYTAAEFLACYGSPAQWERAKDEHRIDPADQKAYTQKDFIVCYGGTAEWDKALPVSTRATKAAAAAPAAPAPAPATPTPAATPAPTPAAPSSSSSTTPPQPQQPAASGGEAQADTARPSGPASGSAVPPPRKAERRVVSLSEQMQRLQASGGGGSSKPSGGGALPSRAAADDSEAGGMPRTSSSTSSGGAGSPRSGRPSPGVAGGGSGAAVAPRKPVREGLVATPGLDLAGVKPVPLTFSEKDADGTEHTRSTVTLVVVGHVDAGKSTLMGHLLVDLGVIPQRTMHKFEKESKAIGKASFHFAWVLDETDEERERGVTMDIATAYFTLSSKRVTVLDAPGHAAFQGNTCLGASQADAAIIVANAVSGEFEAGIERGQTKEATFILRGSGISHLIIAVNKLDSVGFDKARFGAIKSKLTEFLLKTGFRQENIQFIPVSGLTGTNLVKKAEPGVMDWWDGPTLAEAIDGLPPLPRLSEGVPLRMSISDVLKSGIAGTVQTGKVSAGSKVVIQPGGIAASVKSIERHQKGVDTACAGDNVELTLPSSVDMAQVGIGMSVSTPDFPCKVARFVEAHIMNVTESLFITKSYKCVVHIQTAIVEATVSRMIPINGKSSKLITGGKVGGVLLAFSTPVCVEIMSEFKGFGRVILRANGTTVAMGAVTKVFPE